MNILSAFITSITGPSWDHIHPAALSSNRQHLLDIPEDLLEQMFSGLCMRDLGSCALVCTSFRRLSQGVLAAKKQVHTDRAKRVHAGHSHLLLRWLANHCQHAEDISLTFLPLFNARQLGLLDAWLPFARACGSLTTLTLLNVHINDLCMSAIAESAPRLQQLVLGSEQGSVHGCLVGDRGMRTIAAKCPEMQRLALLRCRVGDSGLRAFVNHGRDLTHVTLHLCEQVTRNGVIIIAEGCGNLQSLDVLLCEVGVNSVTCLDFASMFVFASKCKELQELHVSEELTRSGVLDDACLSLLLEGCHKLHTLEFVQVELTDLSMLKLSRSCTSLRSLVLEHSYVSDAGLKQVARNCLMLQELRIVGRNEHLWMHPAETMLPGPTVAVLQEFGQHSRHLTSLYCSGLSNSPLLAEDRPLIEPHICCQLRTLALNWLKVEAASFKARLIRSLAHCSSLTSLSLVGFHDDMQEVVQSLPLSAMQALTSLDFSHTRTNTRSLQFIAENMPVLEVVKLAACVCVTDNGLRALQHLMQLQHLDLHNVPLVTDDGVTTLAKTCRSLTHLNVGHSPGSSHQVTLDGCKALYQISKHLNTHLHVELGLPHPPSAFQQRSLLRMQRLAELGGQRNMDSASW